MTEGRYERVVLQKNKRSASFNNRRFAFVLEYVSILSTFSPYVYLRCHACRQSSSCCSCCSCLSLSSDPYASYWASWAYEWTSNE